MRRMLSAKLIEGFKAPGTKRLEVFDAGLQCFGIRVSPNGRKAWFVVIRQQGRQKRITIGTWCRRGLVGIECGVVSGVINLESSGVEASD